MSLKVLRKGVAHTSDLIDDKQYRRQPLFVDTFTGSDGNDGTSWDNAFKTMASALSAVETGGIIYLFGKVAEECIGSNLKFDVTIQGVGSLHHFDQPSSAYHGGASVWQSPGSPAASLLQIRGRGWKIKNILFDCPTGYSAIKLVRNALSDTSEYDASHATIEGCDFRSGLYGIQDSGGCFNVTIKDNVFETLDATTSGAGMVGTDALNAIRRWMISGNFFQPDSTTEGNERHIVMALNGSFIKDNIFGRVKNTGKYIDLTNGADNVVTGNFFDGDYTTADYVAGTRDMWYGNRCAVTGTTAPDGVSLAVPAAP